MAKSGKLKAGFWLTIAKSKRAFLQFSFAWLFAIIVGAFILFLAIYAATKVIGTEQTALDASSAREIGILLNPLETGFEEGKKSSITLPQETRIYNRCSSDGVFGRQVIKVSQNTFGKWTDTDINVGFSNKYVFSGDYEEGRTFYLFSKPFGFPFKVTDVIYLTSSKNEYCFINAPESVNEELLDLGQENMALENCGVDSVKVCFSSQGSGESCDVVVDYSRGIVEKNRSRMYFYSDSLMYAAIFSDKSIYECQLKRIMQRANEISLLYADKAELVSLEQCNSNLNPELLSLANLENSFKGSEDLNNFMIRLSEDIEKKNGLTECRLW
jgi:hypothetical protein